MSAMSAIATAMAVHNIPEESAPVFVTGIELLMRETNCSLDSAIEQLVPAFEVELCGDCLIPAEWSEKLNRYTCQKCGA